MKWYNALVVGAAAITVAACSDSAPTSAPNSLIASRPVYTRVSGAAFTSTNPAFDRDRDPNDNSLLLTTPTLCVNGQDPNTGTNNCNIYADKTYPWLNGGPAAAQVGGDQEGDYFFAVLVPGGQGGNDDPNDGTPSNLSDDGNGAYTTRTFHRNADGTISYPNPPATHDFDPSAANGGKIRLYPYDVTTNNGGVYILAICKLPSAAVIAQATNKPGVTPSDCKYDAFKIGETGSVADASSLGITKTAVGTYDQSYSYKIEKAALPTATQYDGSHEFTYTITVTRTGPSTQDYGVSGVITLSNSNLDAVTISGVTDVLSDGTSCSVKDANNKAVGAPGWDNVIPSATLASGVTTPGTKAYSYTCTVTNAPNAQNPLNNTATVSWDEQYLSGGVHLAAGSTPYTVSAITFSASSTIQHSSVTVTDKFGTEDEKTIGTMDLTDVASIKVFNDKHTVTAGLSSCTSVQNTAKVVDNTVVLGSAQASAKVCPPTYPLTASKTVAGAYVQTYGYSIAKTVTPTATQRGNSYTYSYTVTLTRTGPSTSDVKVEGTIDVFNPNFEAVTISGIADQLSNSTSCSVKDANNVAVGSAGWSTSIPAATMSGATKTNGKSSYMYSCVLSSVPTTPLTNTVTVSWPAAKLYGGESQLAAGPTSYTSGAITFAPTINYPTATVTDAFNGGAPSQLFVMALSDPSPKSVTYTRTVTTPANTCTTYPNTASFVSVGTNGLPNLTGSQPRSVTLCANLSGGATMGFWQNNNGQNLIAAVGASGNVCNLTGYLRAYGPFQDLSAIAACGSPVPTTTNYPSVQKNTVTQYVASVIAMANAGNATMAAMLKAQMLATALDAYDGTGSSNTYQGNKFGKIGGAKIDLTNVNGKNYCSTWGFAVISPCVLKVSELLTYAGSTAWAGANGVATSWFGNNATTQGNAKNTFDAINNNQALIAP